MTCSKSGKGSRSRKGSRSGKEKGTCKEEEEIRSHLFEKQVTISWYLIAKRKQGQVSSWEKKAMRDS